MTDYGIDGVTLALVLAWAGLQVAIIGGLIWAGWRYLR